MNEAQKSVLIVEDQPDALQMLQDVVLSIHPDAEITACATVTHALMQMHLEWHLALINLRLLDGSGMTVLQQLKDQQLQIPAIVTTLCQN